MPLSVIIVDDEQLARDELTYLLRDVEDLDIIGQGKNGLEAVTLIKETSPDLVFLDVQMPGLDGFGVIKKLLEKKIPLPNIVFSTAFDQYAVKAFEVSALDYILKPFDKKRIAQAVEKARKTQEPEAGSQRKTRYPGETAGAAEARRPPRFCSRPTTVSFWWTRKKSALPPSRMASLRWWPRTWRASPTAGPWRNCWPRWMRTYSGARIAPISSTSTASRKWCRGSKAAIRFAWTTRSRRRFR